MNSTDPIVFVLNGDPGIRSTLCELIAPHYSTVLPFASASEYLRFAKPDVPGCVILDVDLPDMSGLDLQQQIAATDSPILFVTQRSDVASSVRAIKAGALDFISIPVETANLLTAIQAAILHDRSARVQRAAEIALRRRYTSLTTRERQVLRLVVSGLRNKQSASELGISECTLEIHRGQVTRKMKAPSVADLVRMAETLKVPYYNLRERSEGLARHELKPSEGQLALCASGGR